MSVLLIGYLSKTGQFFLTSHTMLWSCERWSISPPNGKLKDNRIPEITYSKGGLNDHVLLELRLVISCNREEACRQNRFNKF